MNQVATVAFAMWMCLTAWMLGVVANDLINQTHDQPSPEHVLYLQEEIKYDFKAVIAAASVLCETGEPLASPAFGPKDIYLMQVSDYNEHQKYLKDIGYNGPAEYPESIPNLDSPGYTDWCEVQREVTGLSCADDV